jgi:hypothetical protein
MIGMSWEWELAVGGRDGHAKLLLQEHDKAIVSENCTCRWSFRKGTLQR